MLVRNKLEHKTCSDGMLLPERISPIVMRPVGCDALLLCNLPTSTVRISFAHVLRFFPVAPSCTIFPQRSSATLQFQLLIRTARRVMSPTFLFCCPFGHIEPSDVEGH